LKRATGKPVLITNAERSQDDQLRSREIRYALMMGLRVVCLIAGALLAYARVPLWQLWSALCVVGMVLLPWMAVLIANDRPPRAEHQLRTRLHRHPAPPQPEEPGQRSLPAGTEHSPDVIDQER
jgi:cytochrome c-type biogenesis protein CcmH/NrfG